MDEREQRLQIIRRILRRSSVVSQARLVELLDSEGFAVTQSSVSRDLRDLRVRKVNGEYRLVPAVDARNGADLDDILARNLDYLEPAGSNLLVLHTTVGSASRVALALDGSGWPELLGTIAGDDTIFIATSGLRDQKRVVTRLTPCTAGGP